MSTRVIVKVQPFGRSIPKPVTVAGTTGLMQAAFGETLEFYFNDGVIDLSTLRLLFTHVRAGPINTALESQPRDTECCIEKLEVLLGNTVIESIEDHHMLFFILSTWAMDGDFQVDGNSYQRAWTNRRLLSTGRDLNGVPFCAEKFIGFLGSGAIIDTRRTGKLTIRLRLVPQTFITTSNSQNIHGIRDVFFRVAYLPDDTPTSSRISFDTYDSTKVTHPSYNSRTTLVLDGRKRLKHVLARPMSTSTHLPRGSIVHVATNLTLNFLSNSELINDWNFSINEKRINAQDCSRNEGIASMKEVFPRGVVSIVPNSDLIQSETVGLNRSWSAAAVLDMTQREDGGQHEIAFYTKGNSNIPQITYMFVCHPVELDWSSGTLVLSQ